jgi:iron only hydrogenase large subunit-like protein
MLLPILPLTAMLIAEEVEVKPMLTSVCPMWAKL